MDSNQSGAVGGIILGVFQGSLTHLGASRRLRGQKYIKARPILGHILTFFAPPLPTRSNFFGPKQLVQVSHIQYYMFHVELAPVGGILGPLKSDLGVFWAKIPLYPYNVKFSNSIFSKTPILPILSFWILNLHIIICQFQKRSSVKHFFSLTACSCHMCID